jgi:hypothetical protein
MGDTHHSAVKLSPVDAALEECSASRISSTRVASNRNVTGEKYASYANPLHLVRGQSLLRPLPFRPLCYPGHIRVHARSLSATLSLVVARCEASHQDSCHTRSPAAASAFASLLCLAFPQAIQARPAKLPQTDPAACSTIDAVAAPSMRRTYFA